MKTLLLVTYVDFWRMGSGHRTRINSIVNYLKDKVRITVYFAGSEDKDDKILINLKYPEIEFEFATNEMPITFKEYNYKFRIFIKNKLFDFALIEYIELSMVLEFLPENTVTILDTHDVVFERIKSFKKYRLGYDGVILSKREELNIYNCYDYVLLIQKNDFEKISKVINPCKLLLVPHATNLKKKKFHKTAKHVGYIASQYNPNLDALNWFIKNVWDEIFHKHNLTLNIYGNIKDSFPPSSEMHNKNIIFHGFVDDLDEQYAKLDIVINPVRCGAGLKIKNVEALGHGLPLITSSHGASGIEDGASKAFLIANKPKEYYRAFDYMLRNYRFRKQIAENAFRYAQLYFSEKQCYSNILKIIN
jgi:glycosyltransferase involved in cell wall biosynthesis